MLSIVSGNIEIYNYADDNTVICSGYEYEDVKAELMLNVDKIIEWFQDNNVKVNPDKLQCIVFGKVVNPDTFIINGNVVRPEERVKLLGVHIDNKLNFDHHVSHICSGSAWGWTSQSIPQPVPSLDKRGGLASGASRL